MPDSETTELTKVPEPGDIARVAGIQADHYESRAQAANTRRAYQMQWTAFESWARSAGLEPMPASVSTVRAYIAHLASTKRPATIKLALAAIRRGHESFGVPTPTSHPSVRNVMQGVCREIGVAQRQAKALMDKDLWRVLGAIAPDPESKSNDLRAARDRAMLLIGFGAALRRSELVALDLEDIEVTDAGMKITIRRSKTDQVGEGRIVGIPNRDHIVSDALNGWLTKSGIASGPIFRNIDRHGRILDRLTPHSVMVILRLRLKSAGIDPKPYSGHSLRSGLATSAAMHGANEAAIKQQTGHKSADMVHRYIRPTSIFKNNAAEKVGL